MSCQRCKKDRVIYVQGKTSDMCFVRYKDKEHDGYVPDSIGLKDDGAYGDYVQIEYCLECGQVQGKFPIDDETVFDALERRS